MRQPTRQTLAELASAGPHEVLRGELALVGLPGVVFTPAAGLGCPAVAFGHGWLQPVARYTALLSHLASWGIVAAAPATQHGPFASHRALAADLVATLDVCCGVRLGSGGIDGRISVDPRRLALAGHGMGGGAAVLAAAAAASIAASAARSGSGSGPVAAVVTLAVAESRPSAIDGARSVSVPGLHVAAGKDRVSPPAGNAEPIAAAWAGSAWLRTLPKATHLGFTAGRHWSDLILDGSPDAHTHKITRALVTAFLLRHLTGQRAYDELLDHPVRGTELRIFA